MKDYIGCFVHTAFVKTFSDEIALQLHNNFKLKHLTTTEHEFICEMLNRYIMVIKILLETLPVKFTYMYVV